MHWSRPCSALYTGIAISVFMVSAIRWYRTTRQDTSINSKVEPNYRWHYAYHLETIESRPFRLSLSIQPLVFFFFSVLQSSVWWHLFVSLSHFLFFRPICFWWLRHFILRMKGVLGSITDAEPSHSLYALLLLLPPFYSRSRYLCHSLFFDHE